MGPDLGCGMLGLSWRRGELRRAPACGAGAKGVSVFDRSQVAPLPGEQPTPLDPPCEPLTGDSHAHLLAPLQAFTESFGFTVSFESIPGAKTGDSFGFTSRLSRSRARRLGTGSPAPDISWHRHLTLDLAAIVLTTVQRRRYPFPLGSAKAYENPTRDQAAQRSRPTELRAQASLAMIVRSAWSRPLCRSCSAVIVHAPG